ncbi:MAG: AAA family ATPase, partial [Acidimicrobiales bacterium]
MTLAPLIDRVDELRRLHRLWNDVTGRVGARLAFVHGPRQVGKTFLLVHLAAQVRSQGGTAVLATALPGASERQQLDGLVSAMRRDMPDDASLVPDRIADWPAAFALLCNFARRQTLLVVLDEVPWYLATTRTWPGHLQVAWDAVRRENRPPALLLVLTGSAVATMRDLMGGEGALFGRADDELAVAPFDLPAAAELLGPAPAQVVIEAYAACGGYPLHLRAWDLAEPTTANLERLMGQPGALLAHTGERIVADLPDDGGHRRVLHAIGSGDQSHARIRERADQ